MRVGPDRDDWTGLLQGSRTRSDLEPDPWAWLHQEPPEADQPDISGHEVTAVLVTRDAARWLPDTLEGLAALDPRPARLIAVDNASSDSTPRLLRRALDQGTLDALYSGPADLGFGAAVGLALEKDRVAAQAASREQKSRRTGEPTRWLWLLHDDAVPAPDALGRLLLHVSADPDIHVTGPKLLLPRRSRAGQPLAEVGVSISGTGRRDLLLDPGEIDQGQRDEPAERLGVSTCGMLVRQETWYALGGLEPSIPIFRDGVEFGWRAHLSGYRVVTCPSAEFLHRQVGRAGLRPSGLAGSSPDRLDRRLGMLVVAGHARRLALPFVWARLVLSCLLRALGYLLGKVPHRSVDELAALWSFAAHPGRVFGYRRRLAAIRTVPGSAEIVRRLRPPWWSGLRIAGEAISGAASERYRAVAGDLDVASLDELTGDDFSAVGEEKHATPWLSPAVIVTILTVLASLFAARDLLGSGALAAPALLPAPGLAQLWHQAWSPIPGAPGQSSPPWLALTALASTVLAGRPEWLVTTMLCLVVPLALLAVYPIARRTIQDRRVRLAAAVSYALLPVLLGGTNQGRLSVSVVAIGLPLLAIAVRAIALRRVHAPEALRGGWGAGVVLVVLVAFEPALILLAGVAGLVGVLVLRHAPRKIGRIAIAIGVPLVVLAPWWPSVVRVWGRLFVGPDSALGGAPNAPGGWELLLGRDRLAGLPPLWVGALVFGLLWLVALVGLFRRRESPVVVAGWVTALLGFGAAIALSRLVVTVPPTGTEVRPAVAAYLLIGFAGLVLAGGVGVDGLAAAVRAQSFSWLQPATVLAGLTAAAAILLGAGWWVVAGAAGPIGRHALDVIPPYVRNAMTSDARVRVLAIDLKDRSARYAVLADQGERLGDADRGFAFGGSTAANAQARDLVLRLVAGTADADLVPQLRDLGVGYLWVRGASEEDKARIDNTPGLGAASGTAAVTIWDVGAAPSRATLVDGASSSPVGRSPSTIPAGGEPRQVRLGEAADPRWQALLDGVRLPVAQAGWQQAFTVPADGGRLEYWLSSLAPLWLVVQAILLLVAAVLAAPAVRRPEVRDPTRSSRRAASLIGGR